MTRQDEFDQHRQYIEDNQLDAIIDFHENIDYQESAFDHVSGKMTMPLPPEAADLVRLHQLIRQRKCFTVVEFGLGYSTLIMADALAKNDADWQRLQNKPEIRNRFMFQIFSLDASEEWIALTKSKIPSYLQTRIHMQHSRVGIGTFNGQLCHYYDTLHDVVPDFVYLDGPSAKDVQGSVHGLSFGCDERTVMAADLLLMEPTFLPGTFILVDGRTNNARFLERNFSRQYSVCWHREQDITTFELNEERLGKYNHLGSDFF